MTNERTIRADVAVIGGGLAGISAALAAARNGSTVAFVTDRPVLGGNASMEMHVNPMGAGMSPWDRYARETGIFEEMFNNLLYKASKSDRWTWQDFDDIYFQLVFSEPNITLELNTSVNRVERDGRRITAVEGVQLRSETLLRVEAETFIDCTGDGTVGYLAGCEYRMGTESRHEFDEFYGPEQENKGTMGATILFTSKDVGHKTEFTTPEWATKMDNLPSTYRIAHTTFPTPDGNYGGFWWLEYGGEWDTIKDDNKLMLHLRKTVYGLWGFIKNSGLFPMSETHELDWIAPLGGKRESRRLMGEHILTSREVFDQLDYPDNIGHTGWPIDVHPSDGYLSTTCGCTHYYLPGSANIPARILISKDIDNLMFAGRDVSCTHEALGTLRQMRTGSVMGQAVGTIAALAHDRNLLPSALVKTDFHTVEQQLLKDDQRIIGRTCLLPGDLAKRAAVTVSSVNRGCPESGEVFKYADKSVGLIIPAKSMEYLELLLSADDEVDVDVDFYFTDGKKNNCRVSERVKTARLRVGEKKWYHIDLGLTDIPGGKIFVLIRHMPPLRVWGEKEHYCGFTSFYTDADELKYDTFFTIFNEESNCPYTVCNRYRECADNYGRENLVNGFITPYGEPNMWMSAEMAPEGEWVAFDFGRATDFSEIELVFNTDLNCKFYKLLANRVAPENIKKYRIYTVLDGKETLYHMDTDNYKRFVRIKKPARAEKVVIRFDATHGSRYAQLFDVRINV